MENSKNLLLISKDEVLNNNIISLLNQYNIIHQQFNISKVMMNVYKYNPILIIVDFDEYDYSICKFLNTLELDSYIPIIALHSKSQLNLPINSMPLEYYINKADITGRLADTIDMFASFKEKHSENLTSGLYNHINSAGLSFINTVTALSKASEANGGGTSSHVSRVNAYSAIIAESLGMDKNFVETISFSAQMHDVGKVSIPKHILFKPGKLTEEEFEIIKTHTIFGAKIIGDLPQLKMASEIALSHHEKYDGSGYPYGKSGDEIPLSGRIVALADVYDALRTKRVYKPAFDHSTAFNIMTNGDGRVHPQHFDPVILNVFKVKHKDFYEIFEKSEL
ncbi:MAG: HD-GYP domain-containing protein [Caulobacteraceae bacterium]